MIIPKDYLERVYAGVLGKIIGVYLGRPFEQWSYEKIAAELGDISYYVHEKLGKPLIAVDDDISGTFTFIRALEDHAGGYALAAEAVGKTWLNYIIENRLVLWWGGLGQSTEHTAFLRLKSGIPAPRSGSIAVNGPIVAQQIGAQIFIDGWGIVCPGEPAKAAALAKAAGSVSHDGEAVYDAMLIAAMESAAFVESDLSTLLDIGLSFIPRDSLTATMIGELRHMRKTDGDWRAGQRLLAKKWSYEKFPGGCHTIPNHGVIIMALLWGDDDFQRSLMIANTAGWDTDCNSGNVGCLLGIKNGLKGIEAGPDFRGPVADRLYVSNADGAGCITDAATEAVTLSNLGRLLAGEKTVAPKEGARYHFELPGSVQGWTDSSAGTFPGLALENVAGHSAKGSRSLAMRYHRLAPGVVARAAAQTSLYADQGNAGYWLVGSPTLHNGQTVHCAISADAGNSQPITVSLVLFSWGNENKPVPIAGPSCTLAAGAKQTLECRVQSPAGQPIAQLALELTSEHTTSGSVYLDYLTWSGTPSLVLGAPAAKASTMWQRAWIDGVDGMQWGADPAKDEHFSLLQNRGRGLLMYGGRQWGDYRVSAALKTPLAGSIGIAARCTGMRRYYALLLDGRSAKLVKMRDEEKVLAERSWPTETNQKSKLSLEVIGPQLRARIDGKEVFDITDTAPNLSDGGIALVCEEGRLLAGAVSVEPSRP